MAAPNNPSMVARASRVASFNNKKGTPKKLRWPHPASFSLTPAVLAAAGFWHDPAEEEPDRTTCWMCTQSMKGWEDGDDPIALHLQYSPDCAVAKIASLTRDRDRGRPSWSDSPDHDWGPHGEWHPRGPTMTAARLATFGGAGGKWPHEQTKGIPTRQQLAKAGFHFDPNLTEKGKGKLDVDDMTVCCYCNRNVMDWEVGDDPLRVHMKHESCIFFGAPDPSSFKARKPAKKPAPGKKASVAAEEVEKAEAERQAPAPAAKKAKAAPKKVPAKPARGKKLGPAGSTQGSESFADSTAEDVELVAPSRGGRTTKRQVSVTAPATDLLARTRSRAPSAAPSEADANAGASASGRGRARKPPSAVVEPPTAGSGRTRTRAGSAAPSIDDTERQPRRGRTRTTTREEPIEIDAPEEAAMDIAVLDAEDTVTEEQPEPAPIKPKKVAKAKAKAKPKKAVPKENTPDEPIMAEAVGEVGEVEAESPAEDAVMDEAGPSGSKPSGPPPKRGKKEPAADKQATPEPESHPRGPSPMDVDEAPRGATTAKELVFPGLDPKAPQLYSGKLPFPSKRPPQAQLPANGAPNVRFTPGTAPARSPEPRANPEQLVQMHPDALLDRYLGASGAPAPIPPGWLANPYNPSRPLPPLTEEEKRMKVPEYYRYLAEKEKEAFLAWIEQEMFGPWESALEAGRQRLRAIKVRRAAAPNGAGARHAKH